MKTSHKRVPLYQSVEQALRLRIKSGEWSEEAVFPSRRQICETYAVSGITATRVLETLEKEGIIERVQGRGNFFRGSGAVTRSGVVTSMDIAIIAPRRGETVKNLFFDGFYSQIADSIVKLAHAGDREVRMAFLPTEAAPDSLQRWLGEDVCGLIFFGVSGYCDECAELARRFSLPAVFVDSYLEGWTSIVSDHAHAAVHVSDKLAGAGHRKLGYVGSLLPGNNMNNESERLAMFPPLAQAKGLEIGSRIVRDLLPEDPRITGEIADWVRKDKISALVCSTSSHYVWVREALEKALPGRRLAYYCFDAWLNPMVGAGIPQPAGTLPALEKLGVLAVEKMESLIRNKEQRGGKIAVPMVWTDGDNA